VDRIDDLVAMALEDPSCGGNPVKLTAENLKALFEAALRALFRAKRLQHSSCRQKRRPR
jgi:hypothetical protein